jgi:hypothetical protein
VPVADRRGANNGLWRLIGGLNALTGQVNYLDASIVGRAKVTEFYGKLVAVYPRARRLYMIQDNGSIHRHPDVLAALQEWPQVEPVWPPTYAARVKSERTRVIFQQRKNFRKFWQKRVRFGERMCLARIAHRVFAK